MMPRRRRLYRRHLFAVELLRGSAFYTLYAAADKARSACCQFLLGGAHTRAAQRQRARFLRLPFSEPLFV